MSEVLRLQEGTKLHLGAFYSLEGDLTVTGPAQAIRTGNGYFVRAIPVRVAFTVGDTTTDGLLVLVLGVSPEVVL